MEDREVLEFFLQNVDDDALYYDEEDFNNFTKELYDGGEITKEQYERLSFDMAVELDESGEVEHED